MGYIEYLKCVEDATRDSVSEIQYCNAKYAAASISKFPFGKVGSLAGLKLILCLHRAGNMFDAKKERCKIRHLPPETEPELFRRNIGRRLIKYRTLAELSIDELANSSNIDSLRISQIEEGIIEMSFSELVLFAKAFNTSPEDIVNTANKG